MSVTVFASGRIKGGKGVKEGEFSATTAILFTNLQFQN
jgi:hypothetical protein